MGGGSYVGYAKGTNSAAKGLAMTGEIGPEMIDFSGGEMVLNLKNTIALINSAVGAISNIKNAVAGTIQQPQLAMVGSNSGNVQQSKSDYEAMKQAIIEAIKESKDNKNSSGGSSDKDINLEILIRFGDTPFGKAVIKAINKVQKQAGRTLIDV
jgi:SLT domain-containing protein